MNRQWEKLYREYVETKGEKDLIKFIENRYRSGGLIQKLVEKIRNLSIRLSSIREEILIMNFCGTHEHTITYFGLRFLMPENIKLIAGPGCPVCITPASDIDTMVALALDGIRIFTYGDVYRVKGSKMSLHDARSEGGDIRIVYGFLDAIRIARKSEKRSIFFGIGFETTVPTVASLIVRENIPKGLLVYSSFHLTPPAMRYVLEDPDVCLSGVIAPGHVSTIIGAKSWKFVAEEFRIPVVVAGFEPLDVIIAVYEILKQILNNDAKLVNEYSRVVTYDGNLIAQKYIEEVFVKTTGEWRGLGELPESVYAFKDKFNWIDAKREFEIRKTDYQYPAGCKCKEITIGKAYPTDCPFFMRKCTPSNPLGPCMVSIEGTCSIWARYGGDIWRKLRGIV